MVLLETTRRRDGRIRGGSGGGAPGQRSHWTSPVPGGVAESTVRVPEGLPRPAVGLRSERWAMCARPRATVQEQYPPDAANLP